jgi:hypothetical protein
MFKPSTSRSASARGSPWRRLGLVVLLVLGASAAFADGAKESEVKAAFLYNFTKFVEWPAESLPDDDSPIVIGVLGKSPIGDELAKAVQNRKVNQHPITIVQLDSLETATRVHVLFVPATAEALLGDLREWPRGVLAVGETEAFARIGTIAFTKAGDKVRFQIDVSIAERGGLKISAQLQKLASTVTRRKK